MIQMPGSTSISRLKVYETPAADGQRGGTPHVHLLCTEMYFVLAGNGAVEMIDANGFSCVELHPFDALTFTPGTIHRLINPRGDLEILVVMGHRGLPERGDNVVCFSETWLVSDPVYADAMRVTSQDEAYRRRDRGVEGFNQLKAAFASDLETGRAALSRFLDLAVARTAPFRSEWVQIVEQEADMAHSASNQLQALDKGNISTLFQAQHQLIPTGEAASLGFCGHLHRYTAAFQPEGLQTS